MELFTYWETTGCTKAGFEKIGQNLTSQFQDPSKAAYANKLAMDFEGFYDRVISVSNVALNFDNETIQVRGMTFRDLMEEGSLLVIENMNTIQQKCQLRWVELKIA